MKNGNAERLARLERSNRRMKGALVLVVAGAALLGALGAAPGKKVISAQQFRLVDPRGKTRAALKGVKGEPALELYDAGGDLRVSLDGSGAPGLSLYDKTGQPLLTLALFRGEPVFYLLDDADDKTGIAMSVEGGKPALLLMDGMDGDGDARARLRLTKDGVPSLCLYHANGSPGALLSMGEGGEPGLLLVDDRKGASADLALSGHGEPHLMLSDARSKTRAALLLVHGVPSLSMYDAKGGSIFQAPEGVEEERGEPERVPRQKEGPDEPKAKAEPEAERPFDFKNVRFRENAIGWTEAIGEVTNGSGKALRFARFTMSVYDRSGRLLDTAPVLVETFRAGQTKSFSAAFKHAKVREIAKHKISFEGSLD